MSRKFKANYRAIGVMCLFAVITVALIIVLAVNYKSAANSTQISVSSQKTYDITVSASRGEILDRNGNTFVYNEQINTVIINALKFPYYANDTEKTNAERNEVIIGLIRFLESKGEEWIDKLPLEFDENGNICFSQDRETDITWLKSSYMLDLNSYASAENCFDALLEMYQLQDYSVQDARKIASVRSNMRKIGFSECCPYTFAEDVSVQTIAYIKENSDRFAGADVEVVSTRKYVGDGTLAAHILGIVGAIDSDEYNTQKQLTDTALADAQDDEEKIAAINAKAYSLNDKIGKSGIEQAMESYLRGTSGIKTVTVNDDNTISESYKVEPKTGGTVIMTLDSPMQEIAEASLKKRILEITDFSTLASGMAAAGAVVVEDVNTGAILASASYPGYSLSDYYDDFEALSADVGKPLWNRAFQSGYSPGSTMKPATAVAALEEGIITPDTVVYCNGTYQYIDTTFVCFNQNAHGGVNVKTALAHSCNIFFFECARQLGIEKMNRYASMFGLGQKTGVEISETAGILAGLDYRDSLGLGWKSGETLLAAIGQSDNSFSPLQLTNYCATIANGGTRYVPYLVSKVLSSDYSTVIYERNPQVAVNTNFSEETLNAVKAGMYLVANETSCQAYLGNLKYKVACKTGTAEKTRIINGVTIEGTDGFLIAFGPYEDAQIAITVVIENAGSGSSTAQVAADIFNYYFSTIDSVQTVQQENTLLDE